MKKVILCCCAALLAACSTDELPTGGGTTVSPPLGETLASGTVNFTNNTSLTIGSEPAQTRTAFLKRGAAFDFEGNDACKLDILVEPTQEVIDAAGTPLTNYSMPLNNLTKSTAIGEGGVATIGERGLSTSSTIYVLNGGKVVVNGACSGGGSIYVLAGGALEYNVVELSDFKVYNYGGTVVLQGDLAIAESAEFYTTEAIDMTGSTLTVNGKLYVGGNLTCESITSNVSGALMHVIGNVDVNPETNEAGNTVEGTGAVALENQVDVCVEGAMTVYSLSASKGANVHADCKLVATDGVNSSINITNGAILCASYVKTELLHVSGGVSGDKACVYIPDNGLVDVNKLNLGNSMLIAAYENGKALVNACTVTLENKVTWENIIDPTLYVNYKEIWADADPENTTLHNIATVNDDSEASCSPGFTVGGGENPDPEPEPTPGDGNIVIEIPTWVVDDYILRADDFAIRVNGEYFEDITVEGNIASLGDIQIVDDRLTITVSGLSEESILPGNDYTYEVWMWVNNSTLLDDGTGNYGPLFDAAKYAEWVDPTYPVKDPYSDDPFGCDVTSLLSDEQVYSPAGYVVRYNVYRGLSGSVVDGYGDTPYIKVSIHVQRDAAAVEDTNEGIFE